MSASHQAAAGRVGESVPAGGGPGVPGAVSVARELAAWAGPMPVRLLLPQFAGALLLALMAVELSRQSGHLAMLWYPNAWGICFLLLMPMRLWPAALAVQALAITLANVTQGDALLKALAFLPPNLLETWLGAWLLSRGGDYRSIGVSPLRCIEVLLRGALGPACGGALLGGLTLAWWVGADMVQVLPTWLTSSLLGSVTLLPLGLAVLAGSRASLAQALWRPEFGLLLCIGVGTTLVALLVLPFPFVYLGLPLALGAMVLRFAAMSVLVLAVSATAGVLLSLARVPVPAWTAEWQQALLFLPVLAAIVPGLLLAAAVGQARAQRETLERSRERERLLYEGTPAMMCSTGPDGRLLSVSALWLERMGLAREAVIGRRATDFLDEASRHRVLAMDPRALLAAGGCRDLELRLLTGPGPHLDVLMSATCEHDADGQLVRVHMVLEDVTRKRLAEQLAREHERSRVALESVGDAVVTTDARGRIEYMNPVACVMSGWTPREALGRPYGEVFMRLDIVTAQALPDPVALCLLERAAPVLPHTVLLCDRDGSRHVVHDAVAPMFDPQRQLIGTVATLQDVAQVHALAEELAHQAQHDALTGLPNRLLLRDRLQQCLQLARRSRGQFALMFMDLDHFKQVNDTLGHALGDELLRQVAQRLIAGLRSSDTACRLGGDEFVVLLPQIDSVDDAAAAAEHLLKQTALPYRLGHEVVQVSLSIGIAVHPGDGDDEASLMRHADAAMYRAKREGRKRYQFHQGGAGVAPAAEAG